MIKGPKNAVPTKRGWVSPKGELLKSQKITQAQINEWKGVKDKPAQKPEPVQEVVQEPEIVPEPIVEPTVETKEESNIGVMSKLFNR